MVAVVVIVVHEAGDGHLQITRDFIRDLVHVVLDALMVPLQLPVGLWVVRRCPDVTDPYQAIDTGGVQWLRKRNEETVGLVVTRRK